jgi:hypothetical protein
MKKILLILAVLATAAAFSSCKKDGTKTVLINVTVDESSLDQGLVKPDSYKVTVTNTATTTAVTANNATATMSLMSIFFCLRVNLYFMISSP